MRLEVDGVIACRPSGQDPPHAILKASPFLEVWIVQGPKEAPRFGRPCHLTLIRRGVASAVAKIKGVAPLKPPPTFRYSTWSRAGDRKDQRHGPAERHSCYP